jgi:hypothetical protein
MNYLKAYRMNHSEAFALISAVLDKKAVARGQTAFCDLAY